MDVEKDDLQKKLARAVLAFQDSYLARDNSPVGLLCQVWLPEIVNGAVELKTKGMPFCVAGMGDLLALFRCISCRFNFCADPKRASQLGAPGRVFLSGEPELACNVQHYPGDAYLRRAEAEQCRVQSSMLLPVFLYPPGSRPVQTNPALGIIEVVQTSDDMAFIPVASLLGSVLTRCGLYTSPVQLVEAKLPEAAMNLPHLPLQTGVLQGPNAGSSGNGSFDIDGPIESPMHAVTEEKHKDSMDDNSEGNDDEDDDDNDDDSDFELGQGDQYKISTRSGRVAKNDNKSKQKSSIKQGARKAGVNLTLADLQSQFGLGLKEAAASLGVCSTTLKRACRRHGIQRWPRRALQKVNKALDEMERRGNFAQALYGAPILQMQALQSAPPPVDTRWATLASMLPGLADRAMPAVSNMSLEGAVAITNGKKPEGAPDNNNTGPAVVSGFTQWNGNTGGTAAGAQLHAAMVQQQQQNAPQPTNNPVVPSFLNPDVTGAGRTALHSPFGDATLPSFNPGLAGGLGEGPTFSLPNLSQLSVPSLPPSVMFGINGGFGNVPALSGLLTTGQFGTLSPKIASGQQKDDVGLLDSTILELILSEDTRGLVGASDEELKRLFGGAGGNGNTNAPAAGGMEQGATDT